MEGVVPWSDHIQAIHSQRLILRSMNLLGQPETKLLTDEILANEKSMFEDEGVDCSFSCMKAFVWDFEGFQNSQWSFLASTITLLMAKEKSFAARI